MERHYVEEHAEAWTRELARETLRTLGAETREQLDRVVWIRATDDPEVAAAALMARLAACYTLGYTPDRLIETLAAAAGEDGRPLDRDDATSLMLVAVLMVRTGAALPDPRWWQPMLLADHLAIAIARGERTTRDRHELLVQRLWFEDARAGELAQRADRSPGIAYSADRAAAGHLADELEALIEQAGDDFAPAAVLSKLTEDAGGRGDLAFAVAQREQLRGAYQLAPEAGNEALAEYLKSEARHFADACLGLSLLERDLMRLIDDEERLLIEAALVAKSLVSVSIDMEPASAPPDLIRGQRELPPSLDSYFGLGGHSYQQRVGPIVNWCVIVEGELPEGLDGHEPMEIGIGVVEDSTEAAEFTVRLGHGGNEFDTPITYPTRSREASLSLALLALTQMIRLDFFARDRSRGIRHIRQAEIVIVGEQHTRIVERAVAACRALFRNGRQAALDTVLAEVRDHEETSPVIAFLMNDAGKSEQLLEASTPGAALGPGLDPDEEQERQLATSRRQLMAAEAARIEHPDAAADREAVLAEAAYVRLVQTIRGKLRRARTRRDAEAVDLLTAGVATNDRAAIHLTFGTQGLQACWADRADGELRLELLPLNEVDRDALREGVADPPSGSLDALEGAAGAGVALGSQLAGCARERGVSEIVLFPTRWLHALPFHALQTGAGTERLLDVVDVVYAPSSALLAQLQRTPARRGCTLVAATGLEHAADEAAVIGALTDHPQILRDDAATATAVLDALADVRWLHVCSHGHYVANDHLASSLELAGGPLSIARLFAAADVAGLDLAVLGACFSGAGRTRDASLDVPGGIDSALLAAGARNVVSALWEIDDFAALLFHSELYLALASGEPLLRAYRRAIGLLRSGDWKDVRAHPLGGLLQGLGVDLDAAFETQEEDRGSGEYPDGLDFSRPAYWAAFRVCGLGALGSES